MARTKGHGNPKWTREETILALALYLESGGVIPSTSDDRVRELSTLLRKFPRHDSAVRKESFRNPDGVVFKLQNIRKVATGKGLSNVSSMDRQVWDELGGDRDKVRHSASLIKTGIQLSAEENLDNPDEEFIEGHILTEAHRRRERNRNLRKKLLAARKRLGVLSCDICEGTSWSTDPELNEATFEGHHVVPLSSCGEVRTHLSDMALLCAQLPSAPPQSNIAREALDFNQRGEGVLWSSCCPLSTQASGLTTQ